MEQTTPPSPAPSSDELYRQGLHHLMRHNACTSYPRELSPEDMAQPAPQSRYGTPSPQQDHLYDHASPYGRLNHTGPMYNSTTGYEAPVQMFAPMAGDTRHQPYSTPDTSPPTPSRGPDGITTRSGLTIQKQKASPASKPLAPRAAKVEKPTQRKKKNRKKPANDTDDAIYRPLTELARENPQIPIEDIGAFVQRSPEERQREVQESKTPGKIKRPMNAFMLYRKAYQNLAKSIGTHNNHQVVSEVCGFGWRKEPDSIRQQFDEWAKIERLNHQEAHPGYKFTPSKPKPKPREGDDLASDDGELVGLDWITGHPNSGSRNTKHRAEHGTYERPPPSLYQNYQHLAASPPPGPAVLAAPGYHFTNHGKPLPGPYDHDGLPPGAQYPGSVRERQGGQPFVQDVFWRPQSPMMGYGAPPVDHRFDMMPSQYNRHLPQQESELGPMLDPSLMGPDGNPSLVGGYEDPLDGQNRMHNNPLGMPGEARHGLAEDMSTMYESSYDPALSFLRGQEHEWMTTEDSQFWLDQTQ